MEKTIRKLVIGVMICGLLTMVAAFLGLPESVVFLLSFATVAMAVAITTVASTVTISVLAKETKKELNRDEEEK